MSAKPRGRRPGAGTTKGAIVEAARHEFAAHGYERATIRSIAAAAGVDPATIYHFFDDKQELLAAALEFPVGPSTVADVLGSGVAPRELLDAVLTLWQEPAVAERLAALIRVAVTHPEAGAAVTQLFDEQALGPLRGNISADRPEFRAALVATQIAGLAMLRLVMPVAPIADAPLDELVDAVAPVLDHYTSGDLAASDIQPRAER